MLHTKKNGKIIQKMFIINNEREIKMISIHVKHFAGEIIFWHQKFPFFSTFKKL